MESPQGLADVIDRGLIRSVYQPIVDLCTGLPVAAEALARGPEGPWASPGVLFPEARRLGLLRELEDFSLVNAVEGRFRPEDEQIVAAAVGLSRFGVGARHLRTIHSSIQREAGLLEQLLAPSLRSRNPERQSAGLEDLETLSGLCADLTEAVLLRDLGGMAR